MPDRYRRPLLFIAAGIAIFTLVAMIAVPVYINSESSDNREHVTDRLNPLEFELGSADNHLLDVALTAPQGDEESLFGTYQESRQSLVRSLDIALSQASALQPEERRLVEEAHAQGMAYLAEIADPVNQLTIEGDEEGAREVQSGAVDPFVAADMAMQDAVMAVRLEINETLEETEDLEDTNTAATATLGVMGIISAAIVVWLTVGAHQSSRREESVRALIELERDRLNTVIDSIADGVALFDNEGLPIRVNDAGVKLWGISEDEITNLRAAEVTYPNTLIDATGHQMTIDDLPSSIAMREDRPVREMLFTLRRAGGEEVDILSSAAPLHDFEGHVNGAVTVWTDVTALRSVERMKDEFLSFAAHELRTPLTIVKGYASVLGRDLKEPGQREMALAVSAEADRISGLVSQLLDISRMEARTLELEIQTVLVTDIVDQVVARHRDVDPEREITIDFDSPDTACLADPAALTQILDNLLSNARKYSEPGSPVRVMVQGKGETVEIGVMDKGIGIPPGEVKRIGEKLFRGRNSKGREGSGLGLYIASQYLELQEGRLRIESKPNAGSTFTVILPSASSTAGATKGQTVEARSS